MRAPSRSRRTSRSRSALWGKTRTCPGGGKRRHRDSPALPTARDVPPTRSAKTDDKQNVPGTRQGKVAGPLRKVSAPSTRPLGVGGKGWHTANPSFPGRRDIPPPPRDAPLPLSDRDLHQFTEKTDSNKRNAPWSAVACCRFPQPACWRWVGQTPTTLHANRFAPTRAARFRDIKRLTASRLAGKSGSRLPHSKTLRDPQRATDNFPNSHTPINQPTP